MKWKPFIVIDQHSKARLEFDLAKDVSSYCLGRYFSSMIIIVHGKHVFDASDHPEECVNDKRLEKDLRALEKSC
jgi:hypothetical protein